MCCKNILLIQQFCDTSRQSFYASIKGKNLTMFQCAASTFMVQQSKRIRMLYLDCWFLQIKTAQMLMAIHQTRHNNLHFQWQSRSESSTQTDIWNFGDRNWSKTKTILSLRFGCEVSLPSQNSDKQKQIPKRWGCGVTFQWKTQVTEYYIL